MIGAVLALVPRAVLAGVAVAALGLAGVQSWRLASTQGDLVEVRQAMASQRTAMLEAEARAERDARAEEQRRATAVQEVRQDAQRRIQAARADAAGARAAADGLREYAAGLAAGGSCSTGDPGTAGRGPAADAAGPVLADMLGRAVDAAVELAAVADARGAAGEACQRAYSALIYGR